MSRAPVVTPKSKSNKLPRQLPAPNHATASIEVQAKVQQIVWQRSTHAMGQLQQQLLQAQSAWSAAACSFAASGDGGLDGQSYLRDAAQRTLLFWDTLRQRGNNFLEHQRQGMPPVLHFEHEMVMDGRTFERPCNYALLRIIPPPGVTLNPAARPYLIIDPRGGHGPGIGGFKADSQVGVALRAGHPVYFVVFFPHPEPGQTLLDVSAAERAFAEAVRALHPAAPKPAIVGNCQGGWAAMMLAAAYPDTTGPVVVVGAPMSYWGGAWSEGAGDNPMRYAGGLLGGAWLASASSDLGAGKFDGAWLVQNFENLNPANTFWDKYRHLYANIDTEPQRFLEFERWWGGYYLMNGEEIEWITQNLFVGNQLWTGTTKAGAHQVFDLRQVKVPIILFASKGDNITPPQQAFNWVADVYGSTDEIKQQGQVIVGLMHEDIGHLGIFVSAKVASKEHASIVSVLDCIESLPPGLYGMQLRESPDTLAQGHYEVSFEELDLQAVTSQLNRYERDDEAVFESVKAVSEFNQRAYELLIRPWLRQGSNELTAEAARALHPMRLQRWSCSDLNPWLWWLQPAAEAVRAQREPLAPQHPLRQMEEAYSQSVSALFDGYRGLRDGISEAAFFQLYGQLHAAGIGPGAVQPAQPAPAPLDARTLAAMEQGGYPEALARVVYLLGHEEAPMSLERLQLAQVLIQEYKHQLPDLPMDQVRRIGGQQELLARSAADQAIATLPRLLRKASERARLLNLLDSVLSDSRLQQIKPSKAQLRTLASIRAVLGAGKKA